MAPAHASKARAYKAAVQSKHQPHKPSIPSTIGIPARAYHPCACKKVLPPSSTTKGFFDSTSDEESSYDWSDGARAWRPHEDDSTINNHRNLLKEAKDALSVTSNSTDLSFQYSESSPTNRDDVSPPYKPTSPVDSIASDEDGSDLFFDEDDSLSLESSLRPKNVSDDKLRKAYYNLYARYQGISVVLDNSDERMQMLEHQVKEVHLAMQSFAEESLKRNRREMHGLAKCINANTDQIESMQRQLNEQMGNVRKHLMSLTYMQVRSDPSFVSL